MPSVPIGKNTGSIGKFVEPVPLGLIERPFVRSVHSCRAANSFASLGPREIALYCAQLLLTTINITEWQDSPRKCKNVSDPAGMTVTFITA